MERFKKVNYSCIVRAVDGNNEAIIEILDNYEPYIKRVCTKKLYNDYGNAYYIFDEDLAQKIRIRLLISINKFSINNDKKLVGESFE